MVGKYLIQPEEASGYCACKTLHFVFLFAEQENGDILIKTQGRGSELLRKKLFCLELWSLEYFRKCIFESGICGREGIFRYFIFIYQTLE